MKPTNSPKRKIIIHNIGLCEHKTFFGMVRGHCIKCGKAFKNCDICYPGVKEGKKEEDWEKIFMEHFQFKLVNNMGEGWGVEDQRENIVNFVRDILASQREEIIEEIKEWA